MGIRRNSKGMGMEDSPFMLLAAVFLLLLVSYVGVNTLSVFAEGNDYQAAVNAATDLFKRAKLLSLAHDGSYDRLQLNIPSGYAIVIEGGVTPQRIIRINESHSDSSPLIEEMRISGVYIMSNSSPLASGEHELYLRNELQERRIRISK